MFSILVANTKGGCGKTTIATNLAAAFAAGGFASVLADADRQRSASAWADRRPPGAARVELLDWSREPGDVPVGPGRLVIDAPAGVKAKAVDALLRRADLVILPVLPSVFDEAATARFLTRLEELKPVARDRAQVVIVGNRMRRRTRAAARLDTFLAEARLEQAAGARGLTVAARLSDSQLYAEAAALGLGLFDLSGRRAAELREEWAPLLALGR